MAECRRHTGAAHDQQNLHASLQLPHFLRRGQTERERAGNRVAEPGVGFKYPAHVEAQQAGHLGRGGNTDGMTDNNVVCLVPAGLQRAEVMHEFLDREGKQFGRPRVKSQRQVAIRQMRRGELVEVGQRDETQPMFFAPRFERESGALAGIVRGHNGGRRRFTDGEAGEEVFEIRHFLQLGFGILPGAELARQDHHRLVQALLNKRVGDRHASDPACACIEDIEAGRIGQTQFVLKQIGSGRFQPSPRHTGVNQQVHGFRVNVRFCQGLLSCLHGKIEGSLILPPTVADGRSRHPEILTDPLLQGFKLLGRQMLPALGDRRFDDILVGQNLGRKRIRNIQYFHGNIISSFRSRFTISACESTLNCQPRLPACSTGCNRKWDTIEFVIYQLSLGGTQLKEQ